MPRLGELLVAAGLLTVEQVERALRAQVLWGGRLGTNIVELHYLDLDPLSKVLGRQHQMPAALSVTSRRPIRTFSACYLRMLRTDSRACRCCGWAPSGTS